MAPLRKGKYNGQHLLGICTEYFLFKRTEQVKLITDGTDFLEYNGSQSQITSIGLMMKSNQNLGKQRQQSSKKSATSKTCCLSFVKIIPHLARACITGGETDPSNCQILQSRVNRSKGDRDKLESDELRHYSCDLTFTDKELDVIEMAVYGNVIRPGLQCRCKSVAEKLGLASRKSKGPEMACELPYKNMGDSS